MAPTPRGKPGRGGRREVSHYFTYIPRQERSPPARQTRSSGGGSCTAILKAKAQLVASLRKWWHVTTDRDFLLSAVSRRNSWKVLLPASGILAMAADASLEGFSKLVILDSYAAVALLMAGFLPPGMLWSDLAISLVHAIFASVHSLVLVEEGNKLHEDDAASSAMAVSWGCQVLSVFAMASAGVHSVALVGFNVLVAIASYFLHVDVSMVQLVACTYVAATACFAERRLAQLIFEVQGSEFCYKSLDVTLDEETLDQDSGPDSPRYSIEPLIAGTRREAPSVADEALLSDGEDQESLQSLHQPAHSRSSLADLVLSRLAPKATSRRLSRAEEMFARLKPMFSQPRPKFAAAQVQMPSAASHEAPLFAEAPAVPPQRPRDCGYTLDSAPTPASTTRSSEPQLMRMHTLLSNWSNEDRATSTARNSELQLAQMPTLLSSGSNEDRATSTARNSELQLAQMPTLLSNGSNEEAEQQSPGGPASAAAAAEEAEQRQPQPASPARRPVVLRGVTLHGFHTQELNVLFIESRDARTKVNARETYWTVANDYFLYYSKTTSTWGIAKARRFQAVIAGNSNGVAHSPEGYEIWPSTSAEAAQTPVSWREWDAKAHKWLTRANAGVQNRGKVRPKITPPLEKAVQTDWIFKDGECQTESRGTTVPPDPCDREA